MPDIASDAGSVNAVSPNPPLVPTAPMNDLPQGLSEGLQPQQTAPVRTSELVPAPQAPVAPEAGAQHAVGKAFGKILSGLSGGHNEYTVDPATGKTVSTFVKDPPGQTFRSILALGLMGGQGIGPKEGEYTFTQGLLSGLGGGVRESQERKDFLDNQRRQQAQLEYANQLKAAQEEREKKKLSMDEQLNQVAIADHNQRLALTAQTMHQQAVEFNQRQGQIAAAPFVQNSQMLVDSGKPLVEGYKSLNIDPIATGLDEAGVTKYIQDHPGATAKEMAVPTGTRIEIDPDSGRQHVTTLYSVYSAMTKVPPSLLQEMEKDGAANPKSTLHAAYKDLTASKDGTIDTRKLLPIYRDMTNWEKLQEASLDRRVKESEIARNNMSLSKEGLEIQLDRMKLKDAENTKEAIELYNRSFDPSTGQFRPDVMASLEPKLLPDGKPATKEDAEKIRQRDLLLAAINGQAESRLSELYKSYGSQMKKDQYGAIVSDNPAVSAEFEYIRTLKEGAKQLLRPEQFVTQRNAYNALSPGGKRIIEHLRTAELPDPVGLMSGMIQSGVSPQDRLNIFTALGLTPPTDEQMKQAPPSPQSNGNPILTGNPKLSPYGNAVVNIGREVIENPTRYIP